MSGPIHFKGTDYPSVEAMPPDVRADYETQQAAEAEPEQQTEDPLRYFEEAQRLLDQVQPGAGASGAVAGMEKFEPAWGGARTDGSVPVPAAFDAVSGLGPALSVHEHQGGDWDLLHLGTPHARAAVRYRDGLAYQAGGKEIHAWRWEDVAAIVSNFVQNVNTHEDMYAGDFPEYEYTLVKHNGDRLILNGALKDLTALGDAIKKAAYALIGPPLGQRYKMGESVTFGPVTVQQPSGIQMEGKPYAWAAIQDIRIENGRLTITLRDGKKHSVRAKAIPNVEVLCQLLGVKVSSFDMTYWPGL